MRAHPLFDVARHQILVETGAEVIAGSTRMKAGTAQKIVLNLFSTAVMVRLCQGLSRHDGPYAGPQCETAAARRALIVGQIVGCSAAEAAGFVEQADGDVKIAVLLGFGFEPRGCPARF